MTEKRQNKPEEREKTTETAPSTQGSNVQIAENVVFVGNKPVMNCVLACLTFLNSGSNKIVVKARGRAIPRAVDTVELLGRSFAKDLQLEVVSSSTEELTRREGQKSRVSAIEISMTKQ